MQRLSFSYFCILFIVSTYPKVLTQALPNKAGFSQRWFNLNAGAASLAILEAAQQSQAPLVVFCPNAASSRRLVTELNFYAPSNLPVLNLPDWEVLPYDHLSPDPNLTALRLITLLKLPQLKQGILVVAVTSLMQRLPPKEFVASQVLMFKQGQKLNLLALREQLEIAGYRNVSKVYEQGEYALRGGLLDLFPVGNKQPLRLELFDDELESLRCFDPQTQLTTSQIEEFSLLPAHELVLDKPSLELFKTEFQTRFNQNLNQNNFYQATVKGQVTPGIEFYLPLFFSHTCTLFDYLPANSLLVELATPAEKDQPSLAKAGDNFWQEIQRRYESLRHNIQRPCLEPNELYLSPEEVNTQRKNFARVEVHQQSSSKKLADDQYLAAAELPNLKVDGKGKEPLANLSQFLQANPATQVLICLPSAGRLETFAELVQRQGLDYAQPANWDEFLDSGAKEQQLSLCQAPLQQGLYLPTANLAVISETELYGAEFSQRQAAKSSSKFNAETAFASLAELTPGVLIVHLDHGIGRYLGLQTLTAGGQTQEFLHLEYADAAKLYVPVAALDKISRYTGGVETAISLHKLGSDRWDKTKRKAEEKLRDTAAELLDIYARREAEQGYSFTLDQQAWQEFKAGFPYEETPDQKSAINAVVKDMHLARPMDRIVCGDVGFGKTEVAMRAAFIAVHNQKQVAVLVPTTLLAQQHFDNFKDRFANLGVNIGLLSRFQTAKEQKETLAELAEGKLDLVIGTHRLLQSSIKFKDLGLVIVDEEHRFGVRQKEKLKQMRASVDLLSMTATPIPRTLNMAMSGIRDLSIIATAPARRLAVKTFVRQYDDELIKEAVVRELMRGGQVYFLHNDLSTIDETAEKLSELIPEAKVVVAHGQMAEKDLEARMQDFYNQRYNLLVCSTIIETGIDLPNTNTILIERADKFGLAQLHQLRGRVGRSHYQAYAYLLTSPHKKLTADAEKRLEAIAANEDLGSGFVLASQDLEIRGAGELLGEEQSGQIASLGFSLYMELLEEAVEAQKTGKQVSSLTSSSATEVNFHLPALIPEDYLGDVNLRLQLYKRLASAKNANQLRDLQVEMIDRFGLLPDTTKNLFALAEIKLRTKALGITKLDLGADTGLMHFAQNTPLEPIKLITLIQQQPSLYKFGSGQSLRFNLNMATAKDCFLALNQLLSYLEETA